MLDITQSATYVTPDGYAWAYYGDDTDPTLFYIVPRIAFAMTDTGPVLQLVAYQTADTGHDAGYCYLEVTLTVPDTVTATILGVLRTTRNAQAHLAPLAWRPHPQALVTCAVPGATPATVVAPLVFSSATQASAAFFIPLDAAGMAAVTQALGRNGQGLPCKATFVVDTHLPDVTCTMHFDVAQAFQAHADRQGADTLYTTDLDTLVGSDDKCTTLIGDVTQAITVEARSATVAPALVAHVQAWAAQHLYGRLHHQADDRRRYLEQRRHVYLSACEVAALTQVVSSARLPPANPLDETQALVAHLELARACGEAQPLDQLVRAELDLAPRRLALIEATTPAALDVALHQPLYKFSRGLPTGMLGIAALRSLSETYSSGQVVPWFLHSRHPLSLGSDSAAWEGHASRLSAAQFTLPVTIALDFTVVSHVEMVLTYPTCPDGHTTFTFTAAQPHHLFACPYAPEVGATYHLSYLVHYTAPHTPPLWIIWPTGSTASSVVLTAADIGLLHTTFDASYVDFAQKVDALTVSFFYQDQSTTEAPFVQTFTLRAEAPAVTVQSLRARPIGNRYVYTVTYQLKNGESYKAPSAISNAATIYLFGPEKPFQFGCILAGTTDQPVARVDLELYYLNTHNERMHHSVTLTPDNPTSSFPVYAPQSADVPIYYQGLISFQGNVPALVIEPTVITAALLVIDPAYQYYSVMLDQASIAWRDRLVQLQVNLVAMTATDPAQGMQSFLYTQAMTGPQYWGFYVKRTETPRFLWNSTYFFDRWVSLSLPTLSDTTTHLILPDTPTASQMFALLTQAGSATAALDAQGMASVLQAAPYFAPEVSPVLSTHYAPLPTLAALLVQVYALQVASLRNIAILALALRQSGDDRQAATGALAAVYISPWPADAATIIHSVYDQEIWHAAQQLVSTKTALREAAGALRTQYAASAADLSLVLAASYYLVHTPHAVANLAEAMQAAGYTLLETSAALSWSLTPQWTLEDYRTVLQVFDRITPLSAAQTAQGYHAAGFAPAVSAAALFQRYPQTDVDAMAVLLQNAWGAGLILPLLAESLVACRTSAGAPAYTGEAISQALATLFIPPAFPRPPFDLVQYPIVPITANSGAEWALKLLGAPRWTVNPSQGGFFNSTEQAMQSVNPSSTSGLLTVLVSGPSDPIDVTSYIAVGGPGAAEVDVAIYPQSMTGTYKYQGWHGSGWADGPAINTNGVYWYRLVARWAPPFADPNAVFYAKTYRHRDSHPAQAFKIWAFKNPSNLP